VAIYYFSLSNALLAVRRVKFTRSGRHDGAATVPRYHALSTAPAVAAHLPLAEEGLDCVATAQSARVAVHHLLKAFTNVLG
jgi:hypothetical protein